MVVLALFVRFVDPGARRSPRHLVATPEHLGIVRRHHRCFYAILLAAPCEWWLRGHPGGWWPLLGGAVFVAGLLGYRRAGGALGAQLSPLVAPCEPVTLVNRGPYRHLRHPMYLGELAMAFGASLMLGAVGTLALVVLFGGVVMHRIRVEERLLCERVPGYLDYTRSSYRLVPYVY